MIQNLLFKVLVRSYYLRNTGFFLVMMIAGFGFFRGEDHVRLAEAALNSLPFMAMLFMSLWFLYTLKSSLFVLNSFTDPRQEFLYHLRLLPASEQFRQLFVVQAGLLQPILAYGLFVIYRGVKLEAWFPVAVVVMVFLALLILPIPVFMRALTRPNVAQKSRTFRTILNLRFTKTYPFFFLQHLLEDRKMVLFLSKLLSCFLIVGVCRLYSTDTYDHRLISIGVLLAAFCHTSIIPLFHSFENQHLLFSRNLPVSIPNRLFSQVQTFLLLLIPEFLLLIRRLPDCIGYGYLPGAFLFLSGLTLLLHFYRYFNPNLPDTAAKVQFALFFGSLLAIMFRIPVLVPGLLFLAAGAFLFRRFYPTVEYAVEENV